MEIQLKQNQIIIKDKNASLLRLLEKVSITNLQTQETKDLFGPGEYEVAGLSVLGYKLTENDLAFLYEVAGLRILDLSTISSKVPDSKVSQMGDVDILLLPVVEQSLEIAQQFDAYYVLPVGGGELLEKFLKDSGFPVVKQAKFSLKKDAIISEQSTEIVILES